MYLEYYSLRDDPFGATPNPKFLYPSEAHREALASLVYGIEAGRGFLSLIGPPGVGKTTLLYQLLEHFGDSSRTAFVFQTQFEHTRFMRLLMHDLMPAVAADDGVDLVNLYQRFNEMLLAEVSAGRNVIVVIDEAQNLDQGVLETVRLLSNFETPHKKLLQIVLAGQERFATMLQSPSLVQLRQRLSMIVQLQPLRAEEASGYIDYRLRTAGYSGPDLFTAEARKRLIDASGGTPRNINTLCFNALSLACALRSEVIDEKMIREVLADLSLEQRTPETVRRAEREIAPSLPLTPEARKVLIEATNGMPQNVNTLCFNALSLACALRSEVIDEKMIRQVLADLSERPEPETVVRPEREIASSLPLRTGASFKPPSSTLQLPRRDPTHTQVAAAPLRMTVGLQDMAPGRPPHPAGLQQIDPRHQFSPRSHAPSSPVPNSKAASATAYAAVSPRPATQSIASAPQTSRMSARLAAHKEFNEFINKTRRRRNSLLIPVRTHRRAVALVALSVLTVAMAMIAAIRNFAKAPTAPPFAASAKLSNTAQPASDTPAADVDAPATEAVSTVVISNSNKSKPKTEARKSSNNASAMSRMTKLSGEDGAAGTPAEDAGAKQLATARDFTPLLQYSASPGGAGKGLSSNPTTSNGGNSIASDAHSENAISGSVANSSGPESGSVADRVATTTGASSYDLPVRGADATATNSVASAEPNPSSDTEGSVVPPPTTVEPPVAVKDPAPLYPLIAKRSGIWGKVVLEVVVGTDGHVHAPHTISGPPVLAQAAIEAMREWVYTPSSVGGHPVESSVRVEFMFNRPESGW